MVHSRSYSSTSVICQRYVINFLFLTRRPIAKFQNKSFVFFSNSPVVCSVSVDRLLMRIPTIRSPFIIGLLFENRACSSFTVF